jgi:hypothetical protein
MALKLTPRLSRHTTNGWPPYRSAGIRVTAISPGRCHGRVELRPGLWNRDNVGTHLGGSLSAPADPLDRSVLGRVLGDACLVRDRAAHIEFVKPGRGVMATAFHLDGDDLERRRRGAADGSKLLRKCVVQLRDRSGEPVARVRRRLYVRLKQRTRPDAGVARLPED